MVARTDATAPSLLSRLPLLSPGSSLASDVARADDVVAVAAEGCCAYVAAAAAVEMGLVWGEIAIVVAVAAADGAAVAAECGETAWLMLLELSALSSLGKPGRASR